MSSSTGPRHQEREVDLVVVGLGPGGGEVAERAAAAGLSVVGVDSHLVGGECAYYGCIPTKMMLRAAGTLAEARRGRQLAGEVEVHADWTRVHARIRDEATDDWDDTVAVERFEKLGGTFVRGRGVLDGPGRVRVGNSAFRARTGVVLATGSAPLVPPVPGLADLPYWTNRDAVRAEEAPRSLLVLGGGAVGVEMAQAFARFGTAVTVVEGGDRLLRVEEPEASDVVRAALEADGVTVRTGCRVTAAGRVGDDLTLTLDSGEVLRGERLLVATGRRANLRGIGLETVGLSEQARHVETDGLLRAGERLWAIGDVAGGAFTHMAVQHARVVLAQLLSAPGSAVEPTPPDTTGLSWVTFTDPEVGRVGMSTAQAREAGLTVRSGTAATSSSSRGFVHGPGNRGFVTLVEDADRGVLVGATCVGPAGGEVLAMLTLAVHARVPVATLRTMIYAYPTFHRGVLDALADLGA